MVGEFFFLKYSNFIFFGKELLIFLKYSAFSPIIENKVTLSEKFETCLAIPAEPPRYSSEFVSRIVKTGSFPDFPKASQKTYLSIISSPIIKTFNFFISSKIDLIF